MRILLIFIVLFFLGCDKSSDDGVTIHCDNLVNETLPPGDNARIFIPTAFTPNGDGLNDGFRPFAFDVASISFKVYDDQSQLVFSTTQLNDPWLPGPLPTQFEIFYYRVEAVSLQGKKLGYCGQIYALNCRPRNVNVVWTYEDQITPNGFTGVTAETLAQCN